MLGALRVMTVERGIDPRGFALMAFGGAGPLHACALAERARHLARPLPARLRRALRARPRRRGAAARRRRAPSCSAPTSLSRERLARARAPCSLARRRRSARLARSRRRACATSCATAASPSSCAVARSSSCASSAARPRTACARRSPRAHERRYGYRDDAAEVELVTMRVSVWGARARRCSLLRPRAARAPRDARGASTGTRGAARCAAGARCSSPAGLVGASSTELAARVHLRRGAARAR